MRGRHMLAVAVDHVRSIKSGGDPFPGFDGLMSLCAPCHNEKTARVDQPGRASSARRFKGHDVNGNPIDPVDDWFEREGGGNRQGVGDRRPSGEIGEYLVSAVSSGEEGQKDEYYLGDLGK
jgi:hypothetical protein